MKRTLVILAAMVFSTAFFFGKPSIEFERPEHDFGEVPENSEHSCLFVFKNTGSRPLLIHRVSAG